MYVAEMAWIYMYVRSCSLFTWKMINKQDRRIQGRGIKLRCNKNQRSCKNAYYQIYDTNNGDIYTNTSPYLFTYHYKSRMPVHYKVFDLYQYINLYILYVGLYS